MNRIKRSSPRRPGMPLPDVDENQVHRLPREMRRAQARPLGNVSSPPSLPDICDLPEVRAPARTVSMRGQFSGRVRLNIPIPATGKNALFSMESFGEGGLGITLATRSDFYDLAVQVGPVQFIRSDGRPAEHFIDLIFTDTNGESTAFLYKNLFRAASLEFQDDAARIAAAVVPRYADAVQIVTDEHLDPLEILNASRYLFYRRFPDPEADARVHDAIKTLIAPVPIVQVMRLSGLGGRAYRSVFCAIFRGALVRCSGGEIDMWTLVKAGDPQ